MPKYNSKLIIRACWLCFQGKTDKKIANKLKVHPNTLTKWRKLELWKQTKEKLIEKTIEQEVNQGREEERECQEDS